MSQSLSQRIAEETQLLAEEKWIKEALNKIKNQRNCLQIERLTLESMKAQSRMESENKSQGNTLVEPGPCASTENQMNSSRTTRNSIEFEVPLIDEQACNYEQLNLAVKDCGINNAASRTDYDSEEEDDDMNCDDFIIDMNTFMNGEQPDDI